MNVAQAAERFIEFSGREDFRKPDGSPDYAKVLPYLNTALDYLDRSVITSDRRRWIQPSSVTVGDRIVFVPNAVDVYDGRLVNDDGDFSYLVRLDANYANYRRLVVDEGDRGQPVYFSVALGHTTAARGVNVVLDPAPDKVYVMEFFCEALSEPMVEGGGSTNWWLVNNPIVLVTAACAILEGTYGNAEGYATLMRNVWDMVRGITHDSQSSGRLLRIRSVYRGRR